MSRLGRSSSAGEGPMSPRQVAELNTATGKLRVSFLEPQGSVGGGSPLAADGRRAQSAWAAAGAVQGAGGRQRRRAIALRAHAAWLAQGGCAGGLPRTPPALPPAAVAAVALLSQSAAAGAAAGPARRRAALHETCPASALTQLRAPAACPDRAPPRATGLQRRRRTR